MLNDFKIKPNCPLTFHRAIDMTSSILEAAQLVHTMGFDRILTSGGFSTALEGKDVIKQMRQLFIDEGKDLFVVVLTLVLSGMIYNYRM